MSVKRPQWGGVAVAPQVPAVEAAVRILEAGGNAVDAAVAGALVQGVTDPVMCGIGGFGTLLHRDAVTGEATVVDFQARVGSRARADQWADISLGAASDRFGYLVEGNVNEVGYGSVGVPGTIDGLGTTHAKWGRLPWSDLFDAAIVIARDGFLVTESTADFWLRPASEGRTDGPDRLKVTRASADLYAPGGQPLRAGDWLVQKDQARVLADIRDRGSRALYEGEIGDAIADDFERNGGYITREDLAGYHARLERPVRGAYRDHEVLSAPPPAGGLAVVQMLNFLEGFPVADLGSGTAETVRLLVEALRFARHTQDKYGADPDVVEIPIQQLSDPSFVGPYVSAVAASDQRPSAVVVESPDTTQLSVVDREGGAVSLTHSLGYSSGVVTKGLGFAYNNYMNCFNPTPGHLDSIAPGKRRETSSAPTMLTKDAELQLVIGAPGATRISPAIVQTIVNLVDHGMSPVEAVSAPRVDWQSGPVHFEGRYPSRTVRRLEEMGYEVLTHTANYDRYFARPQLVARTALGWVGAADPRGDGGTALREGLS